MKRGKFGELYNCKTEPLDVNAQVLQTKFPKFHVARKEYLMKTFALDLKLQKQWDKVYHHVVVRQVKNPTDQSLVKIYDVDIPTKFENTDGLKNKILMEMITGATLNDYVTKNTMTIDNIITLTNSLLDTMHNFQTLYGLVHMDIKPANIMVLDGLRCKLIDLDSSLFINQNFISVPQTVQYQDVKLLLTGDDKIFDKSDHYSTGLIIYYLLFGKNPFSVDNSNIIQDKVIMFYNMKRDNFDQDLYKKLQGDIFGTSEKTNFVMQNVKVSSFGVQNDLFNYNTPKYTLTTSQKDAYLTLIWSLMKINPSDRPSFNEAYEQFNKLLNN